MSNHIDLTDYETELLHDLYGRIAQAKRELSIAYSIAFAARNIRDVGVTEVDLKSKKIMYQKKGQEQEDGGSPT